MNKASTDSMYRYAVDHIAITLRAGTVSRVLHGLTRLEKTLRVTTAEG